MIKLAFAMTTRVFLDSIFFFTNALLCFKNFWINSQSFKAKLILVQMLSPILWTKTRMKLGVGLHIKNCSLLEVVIFSIYNNIYRIFKRQYLPTKTNYSFLLRRGVSDFFNLILQHINEVINTVLNVYF